ncbi:hypothetical protein [Aureliella helgolandensis]|uniref:Uncharacterized protein n=1 Tax=Aureliella helgolandensis TaxID=2527968 RepID=A0A518GG23_9BACT|nr:hypothetical protein [Aureliella helgolandensis]QDV27498.1 hypothetical protein Q31a_58870 [Aureliella helgolandensis]
MSSELDEVTSPQPWLPKVGMIWFFIVATLVAIALGVVRAAEQGQALATGLAFTGVFVLCFFLLGGLCFGLAYLLGVMEKAITGPAALPQNPFADDSPPAQILPPKSVTPQ